MSLSVSDEKRVLRCLCPEKGMNDSHDRYWTGGAIGGQSQFVTHVSFQNHKTERQQLVAYIQDKLHLTEVEPTNDLKSGQFYLVEPLKESVLKHTKSDIMLLQLLVTPEDRLRIQAFAELRTKQLNGEVTPVGGGRPGSGGRSR